MTGSYYDFMEQCRLENRIATCDCAAYSPTSPVPDPPRALNPAHVPVGVVERRASNELHPFE